MLEIDKDFILNTKRDDFIPKINWEANYGRNEIGT